MNKWIDIYNDVSTSKIGDVGYLVETLNTSNGVRLFSIRDRPLRTNQSREPRLYDWCGETDNKSRYARGAWKIVRLNRACDRAQIVRLEGEELAKFLENDGYPELIPADDAREAEIVHRASMLAHNPGAT